MSDALITIGITCFREGEWLRECWESVLTQTDDRWQAVIVMDGGADDKTKEVFESLEHPKLKKYRFEENQGPYVCRNKAFELTETLYHFYLDADDRLAPGAIKTVLDIFASIPDTGYISLDWRNLDTGKICKRFNNEGGIAALISGSNYTGGGAYSLKAWKTVDGFCVDPMLARGLSDYDFHLGLAENNIPCVHSGKPFYLYRLVSSDKVSSKYAGDFYKKIEYIAERHPRLFSDPKLRNRLLSRGYIHSAEYFAELGDRQEAKRLARLSFQYGSKWRPGIIWLALTGRPLPHWYKKIKEKTD